MLVLSTDNLPGCGKRAHKNKSIKEATDDVSITHFSLFDLLLQGQWRLLWIRLKDASEG